MTMTGLKVDKWMEIMEIIVAEPGDTITGIQKKSGCTYSHLIDIINILKDNKLISTRHVGRNRIITPTKEGQTVAKSISTIMYIIGGQQNE